MLHIIPYYVNMLGVRVIFFTAFIIGVFFIIMFGVILWIYFIKPEIEEHYSKKKSRMFHEELKARIISHPLPSYCHQPSDLISSTSTKYITMITKNKPQKMTYTGPLQQLSMADRSILYTGKPDLVYSRNVSSSVYMPSNSSINSLREACSSRMETKIEMNTSGELKRLSMLSDDDKSSIPLGQSAFSNCGSSRVYLDPKPFREIDSKDQQREVPQGTVYHSAVRSVLQTRSMKPIYKSSFKSERPSNDARDEFDFQGFSLIHDSSPQEEEQCVPMDDVVSIEKQSIYSFYSGLPYAETKEASQNIEDSARFAAHNDLELYATIKPQKQSWSTTGSYGQRFEGGDGGIIESESIGGSSYISYKSMSFLSRSIPVKPPMIEIRKQVIPEVVKDLSEQNNDLKDCEGLHIHPNKAEGYEIVQIEENETNHVMTLPEHNEVSVKRAEHNPIRISNSVISSQDSHDLTESNSTTNRQSDCTESTSTEEPSSKSLENIDAIVSKIYSKSPGTLSNELLNMDFKKKIAMAGNVTPRGSMSSGINKTTVEQVYMNVSTEDAVTVL